MVRAQHRCLHAGAVYRLLRVPDQLGANKELWILGRARRSKQTGVQAGHRFLLI